VHPTLRLPFSFLISFVLAAALSGCYGVWGSPPEAEDPSEDAESKGGGVYAAEAGDSGSACDPGEIEDCDGVCAPADWIDDGYCDDGSYSYGGEAIHLDCAEYEWDGGDCPPGDDPGDDDDDVTPDPSVPGWGDDCSPGLNDTVATAVGVQVIDGQTYAGEICAGDTDVFVLNLPPETWASVELDISGSGSGGSDLDLYELVADGQSVQNSYTTNGYERLAVYNQTASPRQHVFQVHPYQGATASYEVVVRASAYHDGMECDDFYSGSPAEGGPCNLIMQFPRSNGTFEGSYPEHPPVWSSVRREVAYLIRWAADEVMDRYPGTTPLGLLDMSEKDGSTPGTLAGSLRHPSGTHVNGNDMDVAYYQNDGANNGDIVCPSHNGQFCTGPATLLDAERTAYFLAQIFLHPDLRIVGVDPVVADDVIEAADDLLASGAISQYQRNRFDSKLAWGSGWPFHHHHLHFSWDWEAGWYSGGSVLPDGCMVEASVVEVTKEPAFSLVPQLGS